MSSRAMGFHFFIISCMLLNEANYASLQDTSVIDSLQDHFIGFNFEISLLNCQLYYLSLNNICLSFLFSFVNQIDGIAIYRMARHLKSLRSLLNTVAKSDQGIVF